MKLMNIHTDWMSSSFSDLCINIISDVLYFAPLGLRHSNALWCCR